MSPLEVHILHEAMAQRQVRLAQSCGSVHEDMAKTHSELIAAVDERVPGLVCVAGSKKMISLAEQMQADDVRVTELTGSVAMCGVVSPMCPSDVPSLALVMFAEKCYFLFAFATYSSGVVATSIARATAKHGPLRGFPPWLRRQR